LLKFPRLKLNGETPPPLDNEGEIHNLPTKTFLDVL